MQDPTRGRDRADVILDHEGGLHREIILIDFDHARGRAGAIFRDRDPQRIAIEGKAARVIARALREIAHGDQVARARELVQHRPAVADIDGTHVDIVFVQVQTLDVENLTAEMDHVRGRQRRDCLVRGRGRGRGQQREGQYPEEESGGPGRAAASGR